jgi:hypothetical protein
MRTDAIVEYLLQRRIIPPGEVDRLVDRQHRGRRRIARNELRGCSCGDGNQTQKEQVSHDCCGDVVSEDYGQLYNSVSERRTSSLLKIELSNR